MIRDLREKRLPTFEGRLPRPAGLMDRALTVDAILHYARSTEAYGGRGFDPRRAFDDRQRSLHRQIIDLRRKEIAHFEGVKGGWSHEMLIGIRGDNETTFKIEHLVDRANYKVSDLNALSELSEVLIQFMYDEYLTRCDSLANELTSNMNEQADVKYVRAFGNSFLKSIAHKEGPTSPLSEFPFSHIPPRRRKE